MVVLIHVIIALTSIVVSGYLFFKPFSKGMYVSYSLIIGTVGTGTYLAISAPARILETCVVGLVYLGIVTTVTLATRVKLAHMDQI